MSIINAYNTEPGALKGGDVMIVTVVLHLIEHDKDDPPVYRIYECFTNHTEVPQGSPLYDDREEIVRLLFPVVCLAGLKVDPFQ